MAEPYGIQSILFLLVSLAWILLDLVLAGVVFYRFRASAAGILVGGGWVLMTLKDIIHVLVFNLVFRFYFPDPDVHFILQSLFRVATIFIYLVIGAGLLFIPRSLKKLQASRADLATSREAS